MMMQRIAQELAPYKICVNSIASGAIKTPMANAIASPKEIPEGQSNL